MVQEAWDYPHEVYASAAVGAHHRISRAFLAGEREFFDICGCVVFVVGWETLFWIANLRSLTDRIASFSMSPYTHPLFRIQWGWGLSTCVVLLFEAFSSIVFFSWCTWTQLRCFRSTGKERSKKSCSAHYQIRWRMLYPHWKKKTSTPYKTT